MKTNAEYTTQDFEHFGLALNAIMTTAARGARYGMDMVSSRASCLEDIATMATRILGNDAAVTIKPVDNSRPLHVEAMEKDGDKYYVVLTAHGTFFAKTYSHHDAELIAERC